MKFKFYQDLRTLTNLCFLYFYKTIGFGDLTPETKVAKMLGIVIVPIFVATMGYILGNLATYIIERRRAADIKKLWSSELKIEDIEALDEAEEGGGEMAQILLVQPTHILLNFHSRSCSSVNEFEYIKVCSYFCHRSMFSCFSYLWEVNLTSYLHSSCLSP